MVGVFKKYSSSTTLRFQAPMSTVPPREVQKRKADPIEEEEEENGGPSTSTTSNAHQWTYVRGCLDNAGQNHRDNDDAELLALCNFYEESEVPMPKLDEDSDDSVPLDLFEEQGMRMRYPPNLAKPQLSVSDLRLKSLLRIHTRQKISETSRFEVIAEECVESTSATVDEEELEAAFQGGLPCSNSQRAKKRRSIDQKKEEPKEVEPDDFWNQVEF